MKKFLFIIFSLFFTSLLFSQDVTQDTTYIGIWTREYSEIRGSYSYENKIFIEIKEDKKFRILSVNKQENVISGRNKEISITFMIDEGNWFVKDSLLQMEVKHRIDETSEHIYFSNFPMMAIYLKDDIFYLVEEQYRYETRMMYSLITKKKNDLTPKKFFPENFGIIKNNNKNSDDNDNL